MWKYTPGIKTASISAGSGVTKFYRNRKKIPDFDLDYSAALLTWREKFIKKNFTTNL